MKINNIYKNDTITDMAKSLFKEERNIKKLSGWFIAKEAALSAEHKYLHLANEIKHAHLLEEVLNVLPLSISPNNLFVGTERDSFASSYALINPNFEVKSFSGYCDPTAVFSDLTPDDEFSSERIENVRAEHKCTPFVKALALCYENIEPYTSEVAFFVEQVTGHIIPDFRPILSRGIKGLISDINEQLKSKNGEARTTLEAMKIALSASLILAKRYQMIALEQLTTAKDSDKARLELIIDTLGKVPYEPATNLYEAIQSFILMWQVMCIEQAPNPYAISVGNADRIFEPFRLIENLSRDDTSALLKHLLVFFNVGDRSWAISQNLIVSGRDCNGTDLTNITSLALLDAYYDMNLPQPILSVKLHKNTPIELYEELGRFFFSPGVLTPSLFNDDAVFNILQKSGVDKDDLPDYSIAGCQEPLIMGKDNGNTTNTWLNLAKILELTLLDGKSGLTKKKLGLSYNELGYYNSIEIVNNIREAFYKHLEFLVDKMTDAGNNASIALSMLPTPFLSASMGGITSGADMRDTKRQGTKYNGSGCLIHGLSILADSFIAIDYLLKEKPKDILRMINALENNFEGDPEIHQFLLACPKYGNNIIEVDMEAANIATRVSAIISRKLNYLGNPFRPDWSTPSTHLLYGYWVSATPDGRKSREMLGYGIDPLYGEASGGLGNRIMSNMCLSYECLRGGYASHLGINPAYFKGKTKAEKGIEFFRKILKPLFFADIEKEVMPFYLYVNITTPDTLRKVIANPAKYAPSGVYIMRIHGTFVNFLDLSPEIQQDIIKRLDPASTTMEDICTH